MLNQCIPEKKINSVLDKHARIFEHYTAECENQLDNRTKDKDKLLGLATIYHSTQVKEQKKVKKFEKDGYNFWKNDNNNYIKLH